MGTPFINNTGMSSPLVPVADIQPPHMVAPWVFQPQTSTPPVNNAYYYNYPQGSAYAGGNGAMPYVPNTPVQGGQGAPIQNNFYNTQNPGNYWYNNQQAAPYGYPPNPYNPYGQQSQGNQGAQGQQGQQGQQPQPVPPNNQQQQPPVDNTQQPPANNTAQTPQDNTANTPEATQNPPSDILKGSLSPDVIEDLNNRLNNSSDSIRADAAMDLFKILEGNPNLANQPEYKDYVNAFMEKILKDPSPMVRQGALLAMELGYVTNFSPNVSNLLEQLTKKGGLVNIEADTAQNILSGHNNPKNHSLNEHNTAFQGTSDVAQGNTIPESGQLATAGINPASAIPATANPQTSALPINPAVNPVTNPVATESINATAPLPQQPEAAPEVTNPLAQNNAGLSPDTQQQLANLPSGDQLQQMIQGITSR